MTRIRATGIVPRTDGDPITVLRASDLATGDDLEISTRAVVDATGVWAAEPDRPFGSGSDRTLPSRGAHLVVPRDRIPNRTGLTIRVPGKVVFLVPWPDHWLIGTTDAPFEGPASRPTAAGWEVDRLLATVNCDDGRDAEPRRRRRNLCRAAAARSRHRMGRRSRRPASTG